MFNDKNRKKNKKMHYLEKKQVNFTHDSID